MRYSGGKSAGQNKTKTNSKGNRWKSPAQCQGFGSRLPAARILSQSV